jgi:hypothetical protein
MTNTRTHLRFVIAGLDPAIHATARFIQGAAWMRGSSPRMTSSFLGSV